MAVQFFGQYLLSHNIINAQQLLDAIAYQESQNLKLGEYAVKKGYLSEADAQKINQLQQTKDLRFGEAAVQLGLLSAGQVDELVTAQKNDHVYLGDAVILKGFAAREKVDAALKKFQEEQKHYATDKIDIPKEVPSPDLAASFFDLTGKLLLRVGNVAAKLGPTSVVNGKLSLPGARVQVTFSGQYNTRYMLGVPNGVADKVAGAMLGMEKVSAEEAADAVREFANVVCGNILAKLAQQGKQSDISPPEEVAAEVKLETGKALVTSVATPYGDVVVAMTF